VCVTKDGIENTALRGWPMLNSVLFGPVDQLVTNRDTYVNTLDKAGRTPEEIAALLARWGVSRQIYVAATDAKALAEAKDAELWYQDSFRRHDHVGRARGGDAGLRLARHRRTSHRVHALDRRGPGALLDELRRPVPGQDSPLDGAVRARSHAPLSVGR